MCPGWRKRWPWAILERLEGADERSDLKKKKKKDKTLILCKYFVNVHGRWNVSLQHVRSQ